MGLGPRLDLRVSQSLVMSQQLQAAIKLLALSNVEIEAVIAEELAKNPLLEARPAEGGTSGENVILREDRETGDEARDPLPGAPARPPPTSLAAPAPTPVPWHESRRACRRRRP